MNTPKPVIKISWHDITRDALSLAQQLQNHKTLPNKILAISRGGLIPAALLSQQLNIKHIETICLESYEDKLPLSSVACLKEAQPHYLRDTLIIDDLVDTGKTFQYLREITEGCLFACLYAKPQGKAQTNLYIAEFKQDCWIEFPWEKKT